MVAHLGQATRRRYGIHRIRFSARHRRMIIAFAFILPAAVVITVFRIAPVLRGFWLSLTEWSGVSDPSFIGFANYIQLAHDPVVRAAILNNLIIFATVPIWVALPLVLAVLLREFPRVGQLFKLAFLIPMLLSPVVLGMMFGLVLGYDGPLNILLRSVGLGDVAQAWIAAPDTALPTFIAILIWSTLGTGVLFYSAGLADVDISLYEAASIDGAGWWRKLLNVTIPHLRSVIEFWFILCLIASFTATFPLLYVMTGGGPGRVTTTLDLLIYQTAFGQNELGYSSALGMVAFLLVLVVVIIYFSVTRRLSVDDRGSSR